MDMTVAGPRSMMGPSMAVQLEEMAWVLDPDEQARKDEEEARKQRRLEQQFHHPTDSVDTEDLDDTQEKRLITSLMQYVNDPAMWQSEAIGTWKDMAWLMHTYNQQHPNQQIMVQQHFLELF